MRYSIILPIYNVEKYLSACVESILAQTFKDYEIILVDDGSTDKCPQICDEYSKQDTRITVIHQSNAGVACARNAGVEKSQGEFILCIDGDDYLSSQNILEELSRIVVDNPDVVLLGYKKYFESNQSYGPECLPSIHSMASLPQMLQSELKNDSYGGAVWTKLIKSSLLKENGITFRSGMVSFEDSDWFMNVMLSAKTIMGYKKPVVTYRQREGSISHFPKIQSLTDAVWILETWPEKIKQKSSDPETEKAMMQVIAYYYANDMILFSGYPSKVSAPYKKFFKAQSYLLDYAVTPRALTVRKFYKLFGFGITILLLRILAKLKTRQ